MTEDQHDNRPATWGDGPGGQELWRLILEAFARTAPVNPTKHGSIR